MTRNAHQSARAGASLLAACNAYSPMHMGESAFIFTPLTSGGDKRRRDLMHRNRTSCTALSTRHSATTPPFRHGPMAPAPRKKPAPFAFRHFWVILGCPARNAFDTPARPAP